MIGSSVIQWIRSIDAEDVRERLTDINDGITTSGTALRQPARRPAGGHRRRPGGPARRHLPARRGLV